MKKEHRKFRCCGNIPKKHSLEIFPSVRVTMARLWDVTPWTARAWNTTTVIHDSQMVIDWWWTYLFANKLAEKLKTCTCFHSLIWNVTVLRFPMRNSYPDWDRRGGAVFFQLGNFATVQALFTFRNARCPRVVAQSYFLALDSWHLPGARSPPPLEFLDWSPRIFRLEPP